MTRAGRDSATRLSVLPWVNRTVVGIILATFFSDFSHEMATAVLPLLLATAGLGPAALGLIEGVADFVVSLSKLGGGVVGHYVRRKRPWAAFGYLITTLATASLATARGVADLATLRCIAWVGRGFRGPLRDDLLADAVEPTHYGRAYGLERAGDMLGAVGGPLVAALLVWAGVEIGTVILWTLVPGLVAAAAIFFLVREREPDGQPDPGGVPEGPGPTPLVPRGFWLFLVGVLLFGLGDFSRTFLIWLAARGLGEDGAPAAGAVSMAVLLYSLHNLVSAFAAYPAGRIGDRTSRLRVLVVGYALGVATNVLLAMLGGSLAWLVVAVVLSGVYIAIEEALEKAVAAQWLPRGRRSLGLGILACANAVGDMASSLYVGWLLEVGRPDLAFGIAAAFGALGVAWIIGMGIAIGRRVSYN